MMNLLDQHMGKIRDLCNRHKVARLYVFGSVLTNDFKRSSDIDFVVDFKGVSLYDYADNYFAFKTSLEKMLNRPVDLLEEKAIRNPFLRQSIDTSKKLIYGHQN